MMNVLDDLRKKIDACDRKLLELFEERMAIVDEIGRCKRKHGLPIYDPKREAEILQCYTGDAQQFFSEIMRLSRARQARELLPYNIVLIGFMGTGKSAVGKVLAHDLGREFVDLDQAAEERIGMSISGFFKIQGESAFRALEQELVREFAVYEGMVIACGGGVVLEPSNVKRLRQTGRLVLLEAEPETIYERLKNDTSRPVLGDQVQLETIKKLLDSRDEKYKRSADLVVNTDQKNVQETADEIIRRLLQGES